MSLSVTLEVCANSVTSALAAQEGGAIRVELCENLYEGGTTPSQGQIMMARRLLHIELYVLIRPRGGDFLYTDLEYDIMTADVRYCIEAGCDGIVIGMLNADGSIDTARYAELIAPAKQAGLGITFHRAFDTCADQFEALEEIIELGCERILTSGGRSSVMEGASTIKHLVEHAAGRIIIMPGSGVSEANVADLVHFTGAREIHASAKLPTRSKMLYENDHIIMGINGGSEFGLDTTSAERVRNILKMANQ